MQLAILRLFMIFSAHSDLSLSRQYMSANWRELEAKGHPEGPEVGLARINSHLTLCFRSRRPYLGSQLRVLLARPAGQLGGALERCQGVQVGGGRMRGARIN